MKRATHLEAGLAARKRRSEHAARRRRRSTWAFATAVGIVLAAMAYAALHEPRPTAPSESGAATNAELEEAVIALGFRVLEAEAKIARLESRVGDFVFEPDPSYAPKPGEAPWVLPGVRR